MNPNKNKLNVQGQGAKPIIFSHGFGTDQTIWKRVAPAFEIEYKTLLLNNVGADMDNASHYDKDAYSNLNAYADDLIQICKEQNLSDVTYVGHSVSAMIGMYAALKEPDLFSKLIMIAASSSYINEGSYEGGFEKESVAGILDAILDNQVQWAHNLAPNVIGSEAKPEVVKELGNLFCSAQSDILQHFARVTFLSDHRSQLSKLKTKTFLLQCSEDPVVPDVAALYLKDNIKGSSLTKLKAKGHYPQMTAPEETITELKKLMVS